MQSLVTRLINLKASDVMTRNPVTLKGEIRLVGGRDSGTTPDHRGSGRRRGKSFDRNSFALGRRASGKQPATELGTNRSPKARKWLTVCHRPSLECHRINSLSRSPAKCASRTGIEFRWFRAKDDWLESSPRWTCWPLL